MSTRSLLPALLTSLAACAALPACDGDDPEATPDAFESGGTDDVIDAGPPDAAPVTSRACDSDFDCDSTAPTCGAAAICVAAPDDCQADDRSEPDDGPSIAGVLGGFVHGMLCSSTGESDYYRFTVDVQGRVLHIADDAGNLAFAVTDAAGAPVTVDDRYPNDLLITAPGEYLLRLTRASAPTDESLGYTLMLRVPRCLADSDCPSSTPVCDVYTCEAPAAE
jgi:hypothetical protein